MRSYKTYLRLHITLQISVHTADVKGVLRVYAIEVAAREKDDLKEEPIVDRLRKVSGTPFPPCAVFVLLESYMLFIFTFYLFFKKQAGGASYDGK